MASTSSGSSSPRSRNYDVFLSFRGEVRKGIVSHIYKELRQRRLDPFLDEPEIRTGHAISDELVNAINHSRASIVVISENYASSSWVLNELLEILKCKENNDQIVVPVFYQVDPSHVRKQTGSFGKALEEHEIKFRKGTNTLELARNIEKIQDWKKALTEIASVKGWDSRDRTESELVEDICRGIWEQLHSTLLDDSSDLVGMGSHMKELEHLLKLRSKKVRMVGISGMGGIGKTTIAAAVYERIKSRFDMHCIIYDVKKVCKERSVSGVQKLLLSELFNIEEAEIKIKGVASNVIKEKLYLKKVLIVLDDLDHFEQLRVFAKETSWFGPCSRIIITTRDEKVLTANRVEHVYKVGFLDDLESLQLFNMFAFGQTVIPNGFKDLSHRAMKLAHGLPLALKVLGSHLCGESEIHWKSHLCKLERFPHTDIMEVLKTSYNSLDVDTQVIFLYAACNLYQFREFEYRVSDACGYYTKNELDILAQKSLISFSRSNGTLVMHDLVQLMGRTIVRGEFRRRPGTYKMLWDSEDILQVLSDNSGTEAIEGIQLDLWETKECHVSHVSHEAFKGMSNLKFLIFNRVDGKLICPDGLDWLPSALTYVSWKGYPLTTLPVNFVPINLVELRMSFSHLEILWKGIKPLSKLKVMDLSYSKQLKIMPNLSNATSLVDLELRGCESLVELPALPPNLQSLYLIGCSKLTVVGSGGPLVKLKIMKLSGCGYLKRTPDLSNATSLERLKCINCKSLVELSLLPPNLRFLDLRGCSVLEVVDSEQSLVKLKKMWLSCCGHLKRMPDLSNATSLVELDLRWCESLVELSGLPPNLQYLYLEDCSSLKVLDSKRSLVKLKQMSDLSNVKDIRLLNLINCKSLVEFPKLAYEAMIGLINISLDCKLLPENISCFNSVKKLEVTDMGLQEIPSSIMCLRNLKYLLLERRDENGIGWCCPSLSALSNLTSLCLINLNILKIPNDIDQLHELVTLDLSGNNFEELPESIKTLPSLVDLTLENCKRLKALPELPRRCLKEVCASGCSSLEQIHVDSLPKRSEFMDCFKLENFAQLLVETMARNQTEQAVCLSGSEIPQWFGPESSGVSGTPHLVRGTIGFLSCILLPSDSLKTFRQPRFECDYRFIWESEGRDVYSGTCRADLFLLVDSNTDIPQKDQLLLWYAVFKGVARYDDIKADSTYDQVIFNFSIVDRFIGESSTPSCKAERFGVRLLFTESELLIEESSTHS